MSQIIHLYSSIYQFQKSLCKFSTCRVNSKSFINHLSYVISPFKPDISSQLIINNLSNSSDSLSFLLIYIHTRVSSNIGFHILNISHFHTGSFRSSIKYHSTFHNSFNELASKSTNFHQLFNFSSFISTTYEIFTLGILSTTFSIKFHCKSTSLIVNCTTKLPFVSKL
ncbi:hypothetical protein HOF65_07255 [bacterium]|nr:hypothetical protein [bacterium]MBT4633448.1 hypothetical protein [bacterium]